MNAVYKNMVLFAASLALVRSAAAQSAPTLSHEGVHTNSPTALGPHTQATGLLIDLARPRVTWELFNPYLPSGDQSMIAPGNELPLVVAARPPSSEENHRPNFAVFRLSFP